MAGRRVTRANRPNTWLHRPTCKVKKVLANSEPSTHATKCEMLTGSATAWLQGETESLGHTRE
jgi:hypothetical protein